jgi:hypothetical protein
LSQNKRGCRQIFALIDEEVLKGYHHRWVLAYKCHAREGLPFVGKVIGATPADGKSVIGLAEAKQNGRLHKTIKVMEIG